MDNITKTVWEYIESDPAVQDGLARGIINKRALAADFIKHTTSDLAVNAIISAIRRYESDNRSSTFHSAVEVIKSSVISSKNGIVSITLKKEESSEKLLPKLFGIVDLSKRERLRIIQADESIKIVIDKRNLEKAKKLIPQSCILKIDDDLAEIIVHLDKRTWYTPGITAVLTNQLTLNKINIVEIMSCIPEIIIFFKESDIMKAYSVLYKIAK